MELEWQPERVTRLTLAVDASLASRHNRPEISFELFLQENKSNNRRHEELVDQSGNDKEQHDRDRANVTHATHTHAHTHTHTHTRTHCQQGQLLITAAHYCTSFISKVIAHLVVELDYPASRRCQPDAAFVVRLPESPFDQNSAYKGPI